MSISFERTSPLLSPRFPEPKPIETEPSAGAEPSFGQTLATSIDRIADAAEHADRDTEGMVAGTVDIHTAMISMEKADIMLKLGTTVRNKLLDAYRQISQLG